MDRSPHIRGQEIGQGQLEFPDSLLGQTQIPTGDIGQEKVVPLLYDLAKPPDVPSVLLRVVQWDHGSIHVGGEKPGSVDAHRCGVRG
jgi:hypothetical protein